MGDRINSPWGGQSSWDGPRESLGAGGWGGGAWGGFLGGEVADSPAGASVTAMVLNPSGGDETILVPGCHSWQTGWETARRSAPDLQLTPLAGQTGFVGMGKWADSVGHTPASRAGLPRPGSTDTVPPRFWRDC